MSRLAVHRRRVLVGAVLMAVGLGFATAARTRAEETAASITAVGWWTRQPGASAPPGGFRVSKQADGDSGVAALRIDVTADSVVRALLVLRESGGVRQTSASILACTTSSAWQPASAGAFDQAPKADCSGAIPLSRDANNGYWAADIARLLAGRGTTSVMLMPGPSSDGLPVDLGYEVDIDGAQLAATAGAAEPPPSSSSSTVRVDGGAFALGSTSAPEAASGAPASSFTAPASSTGGDGAIATSAPPSPAAPLTASPKTTVPTPPARLSGTAGVRLAGTGAGLPWGRLVFLVPLAALIGAGGVFGRRLLDRARTTATTG
ncbi:MAG TPA: hypothetical protein VHN98_10255 [Acidimicrobiales bacterium]|nr:hypothetical protein [Acidimicrobiales bacterium]